MIVLFSYRFEQWISI